MAVKDKNEEKDVKPETAADTAAEGTEGEAAVTPLDDEEGAGKKAKLKKILFIVVPVIVVLGAGAGLYFTGTLDKLLGKEKPAESAEAVVEEPTEAIAFFEVPDLLVNLAPSANGQSRFLKLKVKLQLEKEEDVPKVEAVSPRVIDQFQSFLREIRIDDLRGSAGIYRLRQELLYRVNIAARPVKVKDVLFQEILVQ